MSIPEVIAGLTVACIGSWLLGREYGLWTIIASFNRDDLNPIICKNATVNKYGDGQSYIRADLPKEYDPKKDVLVYIVQNPEVTK